MNTTFPTKVGQIIPSSYDGSGRQFVFSYIAGIPEGGNGAWEFKLIEQDGTEHMFSNLTGWGKSDVNPPHEDVEDVEIEAYHSLLDAMGVPEDIKDQYWQLEGWEFDEAGNLIQSGTGEIDNIAKDISPL